MADEKDNETPKDPENVEGQAPEAKDAGDPPVEASQPPETTSGPETASAPEAEAQQAEAPAAEAPQAEAPGGETPAGDEDAAPDAEAPAAPDAEAPAAPVASEPVQQLPPKERRRRARSKHAGEARPPRTPEQRHADRLLERRKKAAHRRARRLQERAKAAERRATAPAREPLAPVHAPVEGARRVRQGIVVSDKAEKTITVRIDVARRHRRYEKIVRSSSTLHAHDENNDAHEGDVVRVIESRPLSRSKRWRLVDVLERAR